MSDSALFTPFERGDLTLQNRIVMAPLTRARAGKERLPNEVMAEHYAQRSSAGLIISEATTISEQANGWVESPGIYTDEMQEGWKLISDAVHERGGKIFLQLWHMGRASHSSFHNGERAVAPSPIRINEEYIHTPIGKQPHETPRALETDEIPGIVEDYRRAAERAKAAGFDGVEIHAANGYLIDQFLQSKTNHRTDRYGGSIENRYRFLDEVVQAVTSVWPSHRVGVRLAPNGTFNDMGSPDFREQFTYTAKQLNRYGLAYLHVLDGETFGFHGLGDRMTLEDFRAVFDGPLMGNGSYDRDSAERQIADGEAQLIAFGRKFISNPDLVERFRNGWPLNDDADMSVWYATTGAKGYNDFPTYEESREEATCST
ncbi:N-ethylmaleimide reductase [Maioricimonas rarisocia]|uniref:N-ethylmaleimide reductase n=1 Tax=Maioricimonas rarisocia TaxID=2528026 RepID=A0A517ZF27_9PLAN|nr:alkene reductase [Maioricimonas rarisocia]QDU41103.1 N-ethylmaleimide reductase [Maioricimonas rarisocia]